MQVTDIYTQEAKIISNSEREIAAIISNYSYLQARRFVGDLTGAPYLIAFAAAVAATTFTEEQTLILDAMLSDMSFIHIALSTGKKRQSVIRSRERIIRRIAHNYEAQLTYK